MGFPTASGVLQASFRFGNRPSKLNGRIHPVADCRFGFRDSLLIRCPIRHAARELWNFRHETVVLVTPKNDDFVPTIHYRIPTCTL